MAEERTHFEAFLKEVRACVLALHQKPILAGSGQYEMVPVGQLSPADVADLLASELTTLPDYTAKVRIKDVSSKRIVEYTVRTVEPERNNVVWGEALQQRMARIRAQNLRDGVVRPREEVEDEMRRRQDASLAEQPSLLSNAALQVSKGVHCEACGADNSESAKFCNQCGSKF
jgi:ribosomal protein L40E